MSASSFAARGRRAWIVAAVRGRGSRFGIGGGFWWWIGFRWLLENWFWMGEVARGGVGAVLVRTRRFVIVGFLLEIGSWGVMVRFCPVRHRSLFVRHDLDFYC